jgi:polyisoprenoid-binding protein YceI
MSWKLDTAHSEILFSARHMMISKVRGQFEKFEVEAELDVEDPENTVIVARIATDSIDTHDAHRDEHLKSPDFLNAAQYPYIAFKSTKVERLDANHARLTGDLTVQDVTRPVVLEVEFTGSAKSPWGSTSYGFGATTTLNRKDWGLTWNVALETGGWLVSDQIEVNIQIELIRQEQPAASPA